MRRGFQQLAILALILSVGSGSMPVGAEGLDASRSAAKPLARTPSARSVASRGLAPAAGEFRFKPLGLTSLRPSTVGRIPVVLVHGLWGSPRMWEPMVKALEAVPRVSGRFQFLTFGYSGGGSIPIARIRRGIT